MKKITIETKYKTYTAYLIESSLVLFLVQFIGTLGVFYPLVYGTNELTLSYFIIGKNGIFYDPNGTESTILRHAKTHVVQQRELTFILFVILYFAEYLKHYIKEMDNYTAYRSISFEKEAFAHQGEVYYLLKRNKFDYRKYK